MGNDLIDLKNALALITAREDGKDLIRVKRKDTDFEIQILGNPQGGFSLYFLSEGVPAAVHLTARGGAAGEFTGRVVMPAGAVGAEEGHHG